MKTEDYLNEPGYTLAFKAIEEPRTEKTKLRITVHGSMNETDLLLYPHSPVEAFQIVFPTYAAYSVVADDFTSLNKDEMYEGSAFRIYEKSMYLDFFRNRAGGKEKVHAPARKEYTHYSFECIEHVVDVISSDSPIVMKIDPKK
ncbi:MAG TPA: hypothetical protein VK945_01455 [Planococcus sp. (in: firmicutes)]|nr:hypothetical protein [Planococcus sp. (in: firmicutes)]